MAKSAEICVIYNPAAGRGGATRRWEQVQELLAGRAEFRPSQAPWHAAELAQQAAQLGFKTVVAAGGDGTVHEVINGILLAERPETAFGLLPLGSGNDYARMIGVSFEPEKMVERLYSNESWPVDVGLATLDGQRERFFCNTLGMGLSGAVTWEAKQIRWLRGIPLYGLAAIKAVCKHFRSVPILLHEGGEPTPTHLLYMAVALGKAEGGGFVVAPEAKLDDGLFDVLHVTKLGRLRALGYLPRMVLGKLPCGDEQIQRRQTRYIKVVSELPFAVHADGELLATPIQGVKECEVKLLPGRLLIRGKPGQ